MQKLILVTIFIYFFTSCSNPQQQVQETEHVIEDSVQPSELREALNLDSIQKQKELSISSIKVKKLTSEDVSAEPCNLQTLLYIDQNLDSLTIDGVIKFLGTFSASCQNNAEFSEWSNKLLFEVIHTDVDLYMKSWHERGIKDLEVVLNEIENPILDYNFQLIYDVIRKSNASKDLIHYHLEAVVKSAKKANIEVNEYWD